MTKYATGNAIGSTDPRDLYDNAQNIDEWANSENKTAHADRFGISRRTFHGMESEYDAFMSSFGYSYLGNYAAGIDVTASNQLVKYDGEYWKPASNAALPFTTSGTWVGGDDAKFVAVGDAALRSEIGSGLRRVADIASLRGISGRFAGDTAVALGYYAHGDGGGGPLRVWKTGVIGTYVDNGGSIIVPVGGDGSGAWVWSADWPVRPTYYGQSDDSATSLKNIQPEVGSIALCLVNDVPVFYEAVAGSGFRDNGVTVLNTGAVAWVLRGQFTATSPVTFTVGSTGHFATIGEALEHAQKVKPKNGVRVEVLLLSGFIMQEQVAIEDIDLGWLHIRSEDNETVVSSQHLTTVFPIRGGFDWYAAFYARNATLPVFNTSTKFVLDASATSVNKIGLAIRDRSRASLGYECGFVGFGAYGVYASYGSEIVGFSSHFSECGDGVRLRHASRGVFRGATAENCVDRGVYVELGSTILFRGIANVRGCGVGIRADFGSLVSCTEVDASNCGTGLTASNGSTIDAPNSVVDNCSGSAFFASGSSTINARGSSCKNSGGSAIFADENSNINANSTDATGSFRAVSVSRGAIVGFDGAVVATFPDPGTSEVVRVRSGRANCRNVTWPGTLGAGQVRVRVEQGGIAQVTTPADLSTTVNTLTGAGIIFHG